MPILLRHFPTLQTLWANRSLNHDRKPNESPQFGFFGLCVLGLVAATVRCTAFARAGIPTTATQNTFGTSRWSCGVCRRCTSDHCERLLWGRFRCPKRMMRTEEPQQRRPRPTLRLLRRHQRPRLSAALRTNRPSTRTRLTAD